MITIHLAIFMTISNLKVIENCDKDLVTVIIVSISILQNTIDLF